MKTRPLDDATLAELADAHGTPLYLLDLDRVRANLVPLGAFDSIRYAQKANGNPALLRALARAGVGVDAVSAGEVERALAAGFAATDIQYTADLFTPKALALVARHRLPVNVGSLDMLEELAAALPGADVTLRVNPGFGDGHSHGVATGGADSKHGIWHEDLGEAYARARAARLDVVGLHVHVGSGIDPATTARTVAAIDGLLDQAPPTVTTISTGGGLPIPYRPGQATFDVSLFSGAWLAARAAWQERLGRPLHLEVEPGRFLVADAGWILTTVRATKATPGYRWAIVDAGFHTLLRPAMYGAYHEVSAVGRDGEPEVDVVVAGPLCESSDVLTVNAERRPEPRPLPALRRGDLLCVHDAGAYGTAMASTYNAQRLPAEAVIEDGRPRLAVRAQERDELFDREVRE